VVFQDQGLLVGYKGRGYYTSALLLASIHPSAWKGNSRKSISRILHSPGAVTPETHDGADPTNSSQDYMLWCCIEMQSGE
jgi:hypothetical protein